MTDRLLRVSEAAKLVETSLSPQQVAHRLQVDVETVRRWIRTGRLKAVKIGPRLWRVPEPVYQRFAARYGNAE